MYITTDSNSIEQTINTNMLDKLLFNVNIADFINWHHTSSCLPKPGAGFPTLYVVIRSCVQLAQMRGD